MKINEIIERLKLENPEPYGQSNGVKYKMIGDELNEYYSSAAETILKQNEENAEANKKATEKAAILDRLGLTADEAKLLIS